MDYYDEIECIYAHRDLQSRIVYLEQIIKIAKADKRDTLWYEQEFEEAKLQLSAVNAKLQSQVWSQPTKDVQVQLIRALKYLLTIEFSEVKSSTLPKVSLSYQLNQYFNCALLPNRLPEPEAYTFEVDGLTHYKALRRFTTNAIALLSSHEYEDYINLEKAFLQLLSRV